MNGGVRITGLYLLGRGREPASAVLVGFTANPMAPPALAVDLVWVFEK